MYRYVETKGKARAPLVFTFHGTGGSPEQFHGFASQLIPDAHVVSPQGDVSEGGMARFFRRTGEGIYDMPDLAQRRATMRAFMTEQIAALKPERVIGLGYSNGANILAAVMLDGPRIVDQAALLHPLIPWTPAPNAALRDVEVLITAGRRDPICPAPLTQDLADYLASQKAMATLLWHSGGHDIAQSELDAVRQMVG